jgi:RNA polymerase sigma-70 factor (ECF subfamily)
LPLSQAEFHRLVGDHAPALYRLAYRLLGDRHEAEDLVQETFRSAWKSRALFQPERGARAWLAVILRRRAIDSWRRPRHPTLTTDGNGPEVARPAEDPTRNEYGDEMQRALDQLPVELRDTLLLVVVGELTHQETADLLEIPLGTVLSRVSRARNRLREYLLATSSDYVNQTD